VSGSRTGYLVTLGIAVLLLIGSAAAVVGVTIGRHAADRTVAVSTPMDGPAAAIMGGVGGDSMMGAGAVDGTVAALPGSGSVDAAGAAALAKAWVDTYAAGSALDDGVAMPRGYRYTATRNGQTVAVVMVNDDTGAVIGRLLAGAQTG
jgi:hypothetical protein